jgi:DNA-binding Xre family transcriptional regulator
MKLWRLLPDKYLSKKDFCGLVGVSAAMAAKLTKGRNVGTDVFIKIRAALDCNVTDIMEIVDIEIAAE